MLEPLDKQRSCTVSTHPFYPLHLLNTNTHAQLRYRKVWNGHLFLYFSACLIINLARGDVCKKRLHPGTCMASVQNNTLVSFCEGSSRKYNQVLGPNGKKYIWNLTLDILLSTFNISDGLAICDAFINGLVRKKIVL